MIDDPDAAKWEAAFLGDRIVTFASAVSALASTPRILKQGLRRAHETWTALRGEIDIDDVLALCVLREATPNAFALIERKYASLRSTVTRRQADEKDSLVEFGEALDALKLGEPATSAVHIIVKYIFREGKARPQGVAGHHHSNYWKRFLTTPTIPEEEQDHAVLRVLTNDNDEPILARLEDARAAAVEDFAILLPAKRIARLTAAMIERRLRSDPKEWPEGHAPGLIPLWRIARGRRYESEAIRLIAQEIEHGLDLAAPTNLPLLHELVYWFATSSRDLDDLFDKTTRERIKVHAVDLLKQLYTGNPELLSRNLKQASRFTLLWLCYGMEQVRAESNEEPFKGWSGFAPTVLDALRTAPEVMGEQVAGMVVRSSSRLRGPDDWIFDRKKCGTLFGDVESFLKLFREQTENHKRTPAIEAVRNESSDISHSQADDDVREQGGSSDDEEDIAAIENVAPDDEHAQ